MESYRTNIIVLFEDDFWVAYIENSHANGDGYRVARHVFGPEPSNAELREFFLSNFEDSLLWTESSMRCSVKALATSPKRRNREAGAAVRQSGGATKAREAVKLGRAQRKIKNAKTRKSQRDSQNCIDFARKQQKKKQKRLGR